MSGALKEFSLEKFFAALSDRLRLRLLNLMRKAEVCVCRLHGWQAERNSARQDASYSKHGVHFARFALFA